MARRRSLQPRCLPVLGDVSKWLMDMVNAWTSGTSHRPEDRADRYANVKTHGKLSNFTCYHSGGSNFGANPHRVVLLKQQQHHQQCPRNTRHSANERRGLTASHSIDRIIHYPVYVLINFVKQRARTQWAELQPPHCQGKTTEQPQRQQVN